MSILVTGANGFIASHAIAQLLAKGLSVHGTVRDPTAQEKVTHLLNLPNAQQNLKLFAADLTTEGCFDEAIAGCSAVIHMATPVLFGSDNPEEATYKPAIAGTEAVLNALDKNGVDVKTFVLTSSMSAAAPQPEPEVKSEIHWSDHDAQIAKNS